jgi:hypothetical protein
VRARFLLDTDWIIDHFNAIAAIPRRLERLRPSGLAPSVISWPSSTRACITPAHTRTRQAVLSTRPLADTVAFA